MEKVKIFADISFNCTFLFTAVPGITESEQHKNVLPKERKGTQSAKEYSFVTQIQFCDTDTVL